MNEMIYCHFQLHLLTNNNKNISREQDIISTKIYINDRFKHIITNRKIHQMKDKITLKS